MLGICVMVFAGGWLADISWNFAFFVHLLAIISLVLCIVCIPNVKPSAAKVSDAPAQKVQLTKGFMDLGSDDVCSLYRSADLFHRSVLYRR